MAFSNRTQISEYDANAANNVNLGTAASPAARLGEHGVDPDAEAMRPSDTNNAIRELMAHLKAMDAGTSTLTSPKAGQFLFDTTYAETGNEAQGSAFWNPDEETLNLVQNGATLQLGQETQVHVRNNSGTTAISDGTAVMAVGTVGVSGRIKVDPMDADDATTPGPKYFLGIATETIPAGGDGKVTVFGKVRGLDTSGYSEGSVLWCDPATAGALTATAPTAPDLKIAAAYVVTSSVNNGTLFVRANAGIDLHENHRVQILTPDANGNPQTDKMLLVWNNTTKRWENQTLTDAGGQGKIKGTLVNPSGSQQFASSSALQYLDGNETISYEDFSPSIYDTTTHKFTIPAGVSKINLVHFFQLDMGVGVSAYSCGWEYYPNGGAGPLVYIQGLTDFEQRRSMLAFMGLEVTQGDTLKFYIINKNGPANVIVKDPDGSYLLVQQIE